MPPLSRPSEVPCHFDRALSLVISTERSEWRNLPGNLPGLRRTAVPPNSRTGVPTVCVVPMIAVRQGPRSGIGARQMAPQVVLLGVHVRLFGEVGRMCGLVGGGGRLRGLMAPARLRRSRAPLAEAPFYFNHFTFCFARQSSFPFLPSIVSCHFARALSLVISTERSEWRNLPGVGPGAGPHAFWRR